MLNWILNDEYNPSDRQRVPVGKHVQNPKGLKPPQELRNEGVEELGARGGLERGQGWTKKGHKGQVRH